MLFLSYHVWFPTLKFFLLRFWIFFFPSWRNMKKNKSNDMFFFLMLHPKFKTLCLVFSLIICEQGKAIVEKCEKCFCFLYFLNVIIIYIFWLNLKGVLLIKGLKRTTIWISLRWQLAKVNQQWNWSIKNFWFSNVMKRMSKTSSAHFNGGKNMKTCFPQLVFMLKKILGIIGSQIETKRIFL